MSQDINRIIRKVLPDNPDADAFDAMVKFARVVLEERLANAEREVDAECEWCEVGTECQCEADAEDSAKDVRHMRSDLISDIMSDLGDALK